MRRVLRTSKPPTTRTSTHSTPPTHTERAVRASEVISGKAIKQPRDRRYDQGAYSLFVLDPPLPLPFTVARTYSPISGLLHSRAYARSERHARERWIRESARAQQETYIRERRAQSAEAAAGL